MPVGAAGQRDHDGDHHHDAYQAADGGGHVQGSRSGNQGADGVHQIGHGVAGAQLKADGPQHPLRAAHLRVHGADGGEAGRRVQVKHTVSQRGHLGDGNDSSYIRTGTLQHSQLVGVNEVLQPYEAHGQGAHHILLGDESGDGCGGQLPAEHAHDGHQQHGEGSGDGGQDRGVRRLGHLEAPVEGLHDLYRRVAQQDDGGSLYNVGPAPAAHGFEGKPQGGELILRQLNNEEGLAHLIAGHFVHQQGSQENEHNAGEVHQEANPARVIKEGAGKQGDDGDLSPAGHKRSQHNGRPALPLVADGTAGHNAGDAAASGNDKGDH